MKYYRQVVREARFHIGMYAPVHYFMGQIEIESKCNEKATSFDGGMGLAQFMPEVAVWIHKKEKFLQEFPRNPYDPRWAIRALILYDRFCYKSVSCSGWYYAFRAYNGGIYNINKEIEKTGSCDICAVEKNCSRKVLKLKTGNLDLCKVNIAYPNKIFRESRKYERPGQM